MAEGFRSRSAPPILPFEARTSGTGTGISAAGVAEMRSGTRLMEVDTTHLGRRDSPAHQLRLRGSTCGRSYRSAIEPWPPRGLPRACQWPNGRLNGPSDPDFEEDGRRMGRGDASRHEAEGVEGTHLGRGWTRSGTRPGTGLPLTRAPNTREHRLHLR